VKHIRKLFFWLISALIFSGVTDAFAKFQNTGVAGINAILVNKLDLSGTSQGAGGVGGLLMVSDGASKQTHHFTSLDGNGNIVALVNASDGSITARYEYGPFGEVICITGPSTGSMAKSNTFRFSTQYSDDDPDLFYYGHRYFTSLFRIDLEVLY
jgi:hypothetical protein